MSFRTELRTQRSNPSTLTGSKGDDTLSGTGSGTTGNPLKWKEYVKVKPVTTTVQRHTTSYEALEALLGRLEVQATASAHLKHTCRAVVKVAHEMKVELQRHRELLTGEKILSDEDENDEQQDILSKLDLKPNKRSSGSRIAVNEDLLIKSLPFVESTIQKLVRRIRLLSVSAANDENSRECAFLTIMAAIDLLDDIHAKLLGLMPPLQDMEMLNSANLANLDPKMKALDQKELLEALKETCQQLDFGNDENSEQIITNVIDIIEEGTEEFTKAEEILSRCKPELELLVPIIGNVYDLQNVDIAPSSLEIGEFFNTGEFGDTFKGIRDHETKVFIKVVSFRDGLSAKSRRELQVEVELMGKLMPQEDLALFQGTCVKNNDLMLVWDYYRLNLHDFLFAEDLMDGIREIGNEKLASFACDILGALDFLHNQGLVHSDLNTKNIFVTNDQSKLVLGDFCFVEGRREVKKNTTINRGYDFYRTYRAPETLTKNHRYVGEMSVFSSDVYSFGVIMYEMLERKKAFAGLDLESFQKKILGKRPKRPNFSEKSIEIIPNLFKEIVQRCWQQKPELRPSPAEVLQQLRGELDTSEDVEIPEEMEGEQEERKVRRESVQQWLKGVSRKWSSTNSDTEE